MARWPRLVHGGVAVHVVQRGNNRMRTFHTDADRAFYRSVLLAARDRTSCEVHAYVLMPNHAHLLMTPGDSRDLARFMQILGSRYVRYFNARHGRTGTLWEGRFWSSLIDSERYVLACSRYIDLNPVRAGIARMPGEYRWSSFGHLADAVPDPLITPHAAYLSLGPTPSARERSYGELCQTALESEQLDKIRGATLRGEAIGAPDSLSRLASVLRRQVVRRSHGGRRRGADAGHDEPAARG